LPTAIVSSQVSTSSRQARSASVSPPRRASVFGAPNRLLAPPRLAVDVHAAVADEAAESDAAILGELDREAGRRADRDEDRAAGDGGFLDELERESSAHAQDRVGERQQACAEGPADDLVHRVVAADVLACAKQVAVHAEEAGRVEAAGRGERGLGGAQPFRELGDERGRHAQRALDPRRLDRDRLERPLAADAAG